MCQTQLQLRQRLCFALFRFMTTTITSFNTIAINLLNPLFSVEVSEKFVVEWSGVCGLGQFFCSGLVMRNNIFDNPGVWDQLLQLWGCIFNFISSLYSISYILEFNFIRLQASFMFIFRQNCTKAAVTTWILIIV